VALVSNKRPDPEILFGRIALMLNLISSTQLTECVMVQEKSSPVKKLGSIMIDKGFLTPEQANEVLVIQQTNLQSPSVHPDQRLEDVIIGKLMLKHGFASEEQINEALRTQALREQEGVFYRLGEIMVEKGFMTVTDVLNVLKIQHKQIMICPGCGSRFNVASFRPGRKYKCKRCKTLLSLPAELESVEVDTTIFLPSDRNKSAETAHPEEIEGMDDA
jgi:DNA-directed RNA polymerase subunit RPC12/RpoP